MYFSDKVVSVNDRYRRPGAPDQQVATWRKRSAATSTKFGWLCLIVYGASCSIYLFPSGLPQASDFALALGAGVFCVANGGTMFLRSSKFLKFSLLFVSYACVVGVIWYLLEGDLFTLKSPLFYAFNFLAVVLLVGISIKSAEDFYYRMSQFLLITAVSSTIVLLSGFDPTSARQSGGFNNPNQLGYFGLNLTCLSLLTRSRLRCDSRALDMATAAGVLQVAMSMSLTATSALSVAMVGACSIFKFRAYRVVTAIVIAGALVGVAVLTAPNLKSYVITHWKNRIGRIDEKTERVESARGWDRILENPVYMTFGAGEGASHRFLRRQEIHSTPLTVLLCYGIPGFILFLMMIRQSFKRLSMAEFFVVIPPLLYTLTHHGLRTTMLWFVLAVAAIPAEKLKRDRLVRGSAGFTLKRNQTDGW